MRARLADHIDKIIHVATTEYGSGDYTWLRNTDGLDDSAMTGAAPKAGFTQVFNVLEGFEQG